MNPSGLFRHVAWFIPRRLVILICLVATAVQGQGMAPITLVPPGDRAGFPRTFFGIHVHNNPGRPERWPPIGFGSIRLWDSLVSWPQLEPKRGEFHFDRLDHYVDWATANGVEVLLPLGLSPTWASARPQEPSAYGKVAGFGAGYAAEPADIEDWRQYVRAVVQRYKGRIRYYELWNEVTERNFFSGTTAGLARLARAAKKIIVEIDPKAKLVAPSAVGLGKSQTAWPAEFMAEAGQGVAEIASFHLYNGEGSPEYKLVMAPNIRHQLQLKKFADVPVWNTESGYSIAPPIALGLTGEDKYRITQQQATDDLPRDLLLARAMGFERFYWFAWDNDYYGFLEPRTDTLRAHAKVLIQFMELLGGATLNGCNRTVAGIWNCSLQLKTGAEAIAVWLDPNAKDAAVVFPTPWAARLYRMDGSAGHIEVAIPVVPVKTVQLLVKSKT